MNKVINHKGEDYIFDVELAIKQGLLKKKEEQTYKLGQLFKMKNFGVYMLAQVEDYKFALIGMSSGNRLTEPVEIKNASIFRFSKSQILEISGGMKFELFCQR